MIATILPGSTNFHAVGYNEHKVSKGVARLIEIQNFGSLGTFHKPIPSELVSYLQKYSSQNSRIRKPQFPIFISSLREWHLMEERFSTAMSADVLKKSLTIFLGITGKRKRKMILMLPNNIHSLHLPSSRQ